MSRWLTERVRDEARRSPWWINILFGLEIASGASLTAWGLFVLLFVDFTRQPAYSVLTRDIEGPSWAWLALALGVTQVALAVLDYRYSRWVAAFIASTLWSVIALSLLKGGVMPPGIATHFCWSAVNFPSLLLLRPRWR